VVLVLTKGTLRVLLEFARLLIPGRVAGHHRQPLSFSPLRDDVVARKPSTATPSQHRGGDAPGENWGWRPELSQDAAVRRLPIVIKVPAALPARRGGASRINILATAARVRTDRLSRRRRFRARCSPGGGIITGGRKEPTGTGTHAIRNSQPARGVRPTLPSAAARGSGAAECGFYFT